MEYLKISNKNKVNEEDEENEEEEEENEEEEEEDEENEDIYFNKKQKQDKKLGKLDDKIDKLDNQMKGTINKLDLLSSKILKIPDSLKYENNMLKIKNKHKEEKIEEIKQKSEDPYMDEIKSQNINIDKLKNHVNKITEEYDSLQSKFTYLTNKIIQVPESIKIGSSRIIPKITYDLENLSVVFKYKIYGDTLLAEYASINDNSNLIYIHIKLKEKDDEKYSIYLEYFSSLVGIDKFAYKLATNAELRATKGLAHRSLCLVINYIKEKLKDALLDDIELEAVPGIAKFKDDDPYNLVKYYEFMGFQKKDSSAEGCQPKTDEVRCKMKSTITNIVNKCTNIISKVGSTSFEIKENIEYEIK